MVKVLFNWENIGLNLVFMSSLHVLEQWAGHGTWKQAIEMAVVHLTCLSVLALISLSAPYLSSLDRFLITLIILSLHAWVRDIQDD